MSLRHHVLPTGAGFVITYTSDATEVFKFEIDDIEKSPWGVVATIVVRSRISGARTLAGEFVTMERVNLLSGKARKDLASRLGFLIKPPPGAAAIDWEWTVEEVVHEVIETTRRPLDVLDLSQVAPSGPDTFLVPQIVAKGKTTLLYAAGGTGKSVLAAAMAAAVQAGVPFLGWEVEQANVLYLDWETDAGDLSGRVLRCSRGLGLEAAAPVRYINLTQPFRHHQSAIAQVIAEHTIGFVILDSVSMASAGGPTASITDGAVEFFRGLRSFGCAVLAIDHISSEDVKRGKPTSKAMGSVAKGNTARSTYELRDNSEEGGPHTITLRHSKANNTRRFADVAIVVDWGEDAVTFTRDMGYVEPVRQPLDIRIVDMLESGPASPRGLTDLLNDGSGDDVVEFEVRRWVAELRRDGMVTVDPNTGIVRLASKEVPVDQSILPLD